MKDLSHKVQWVGANAFFLQKGYGCCPASIKAAVSLQKMAAQISATLLLSIKTACGSLTFGGKASRNLSQILHNKQEIRSLNCSPVTITTIFLTMTTICKHPLCIRPDLPPNIVMRLVLLSLLSREKTGLERTYHFSKIPSC